MKEKLSNIIKRVNTLEWDHDLYVTSCELEPDTLVAITEDDGVSDTIDDLQHYLSIQDIQSIVENLQSQVVRPDLHQILHAIRYYYDNDAFIQVECKK